MMQPTESVESAKQRIRAALVLVCDICGDEDDDLMPEPCSRFSFYDGVMLVITRERYPADPRRIIAMAQTGDRFVVDKDEPPVEMVHISAALGEGWLHRKYSDRKWSGKRMMDDFVSLVAGRCSVILGVPVEAIGSPVCFSQMSDGNDVPNWFLSVSVVAHLLPEAT